MTAETQPTHAAWMLIEVEWGAPAMTTYRLYVPNRPRFYEAEAKRRRHEGHDYALLVMEWLHKDLTARRYAFDRGLTLRNALAGRIPELSQLHVNEL